MSRWGCCCWVLRHMRCDASRVVAGIGCTRIATRLHDDRLCACSLRTAGSEGIGGNVGTASAARCVLVGAADGAACVVTRSVMDVQTSSDDRSAVRSVASGGNGSSVPQGEAHAASPAAAVAVGNPAGVAIAMAAGASAVDAAGGVARAPTPPPGSGSTGPSQRFRADSVRGKGHGKATNEFPFIHPAFYVCVPRCSGGVVVWG